MSKKYLEIQPNNVPASGKLSYKNGNPILTFTFGRQNAWLDLKTLRVSGLLNIWADAAGTTHPSGADAPNLMASQKLGIYGCMEQVIFRHAETKQVAEHIRHYGRFMASYLPCLAGTQDQIGHLSESNLIMPNQDCFQRSVIYNTLASSWCASLPTGLTLGGGALPLNQFPLEVEIHLTPDSQFFYSKDGTTTGLLNAFYELSDLRVTAEVSIPPSMDNKEGIFSFNSITSYFSTLESTNSIINYNLALHKVLGAFVNFIPSTYINNLTQDGYLTYMPAQTDGALANLKTISFLRNGERFPYHFENNTNFNNTTAGNATTDVVDSQNIKTFLSAIIPEYAHHRSSISPANCNRNYNVATTASAANYRNIPEGGANWGVGVLYDMLDSEGVDFSNAQFSIQMTNTLDDGNPCSAYLFIKHKTTIVYNENGVQVIS